MLLTADEISSGETLETDICVIGAGVAGLTLAKTLAGSSQRICLLESGRVEEDPSKADLSSGENIGIPYEQLAAGRYRRLGGCSHLWNIDLGEGEVGPRLQPLRAIDFEEREWLPESGWPFGHDLIKPYYREAYRFLGLGEFSEDVKRWSDQAHQLLPLPGGRIETTMFRFIPRDRFTQELPYEVSAAPNIRLIINATALELETRRGSSTVALVRATAGIGHRFQVTARTFVLAAGATENARLLLASRTSHPQGLGNEHDAVGRYFMEHPHFCAGWLVPRDPTLLRRLALYRIHRSGGFPVMAKVRLSEATIREHRLLDFCVGLRPVWRALPGDGVRRLRALRDRFGSRKGLTEAPANVLGALRDVGGITRYGLQRLVEAKGRPRQANVIKLNAMAEQAPNRENRITLSNRLDSLGQQRVRLDWRLSTLDLASIELATRILAEEVRRTGLGRVERSSFNSDFPDDIAGLPDDMAGLPDDRAGLPEDMAGGWHHMGTTRMHRDPRKGVVDENSKVHANSNLYIAGSSVFATAGYANPTLTIVALTLRLAEHLRSRASDSSLISPVHRDNA